ncbi:DUF4919 domain-containing protein [Microbulbifer yueqingensis]|uniref:DUF4919 domain-containing protein n=1 Tax=Microbulbifer yueqingensis TaxID=658219 RepID=A0A1G9AHG5_9GAMM|nr:DUF4919 domain-containing protein [Microbulbifer yueqingensis]SDK25955.1 protein of unknown function [Microbulbifer yueqingensis]
MAIRKYKNARLLGLLVLLGLIASCSAPTGGDGAAAPPPGPVVTPAAPLTEYERLLAEAQNLSFTLDFNQLRRAYVQSAAYNPYGGARIEGLPEAYNAVEKGEFGDCLQHVDRVLEDNYMSLEAHMIGVLCSGRSADFAREDRHRYMVEGLMEAIESSGDGRSQESAYHTITTSELHGFVRLKGLQVLDQSTVYDREGVYDKMQVRDPESGDEYALYFNVSRQFAHAAASTSSSTN